MPKNQIASWINNGSKDGNINILLKAGQIKIYGIASDLASIPAPAEQKLPPVPAPPPEEEGTYFFGGRQQPEVPQPPKYVSPDQYLYGDKTLILTNFLDGTTETITINIPAPTPEPSDDLKSRIDGLEEMVMMMIGPMRFSGPYDCDMPPRLRNIVQRVLSRGYTSRSEPTVYDFVIADPAISAKMDAVEQQFVERIKTDADFQVKFITDTDGWRDAAVFIIETIADLPSKPELVEALAKRNPEYTKMILLKYGAVNDQLKALIFGDNAARFSTDVYAGILKRTFGSDIPQEYQTKIINMVAKAEAVTIIPDMSEESQLMIIGNNYANIKHLTMPGPAAVHRATELKTEYLRSLDPPADA